MTMRAGPYIRSQIESELSFARFHREQAKVYAAKAQEHTNRASEAEEQARRWASGTDWSANGENADDR